MAPLINYRSPRSHNDLPWNVRKFMHNKLHAFNLTQRLDTVRPWSRSAWSHTDLPRLREGQVSAQVTSLSYNLLTQPVEPH